VICHLFSCKDNTKIKKAPKCLLEDDVGDCHPYCY
jgi:hypothetical protein